MQSSRELFEKVRVNAAFFWYFGILGFGLSFGASTLGNVRVALLRFWQQEQFTMQESSTT